VAPGGVMFAFHDDDPDRALQLCEAVASQLAGYVHTHTTLIPVCAVLTHGPMRQVQETVLGHATNFAGRSAIAAARILAQLDAGQMAVEVDRPEGEFSLLTRHLQGPVVPLPGKHPGEAFQVRFHKQTSFFPTAPQVARPPEPSTPAFVPYEVLASKVRSKIQELLKPLDMQALREALAHQADGVGAEEVLIPPQPLSLIESLQRLHLATRTCMQQLARHHPERVERLKAVARILFGWLVLLAVDHRQVHERGLVFDPWQDGLIIEIPLQRGAGIEVLVASLEDRPAEFRRQDSSHGPQVFGKGSLTVSVFQGGSPDDDLERRLLYDDQVIEILKEIWVEVMDAKMPPTPFSEAEHLPLLRAMIQQRKSLKERYYYLAVPPPRPEARQFSHELLTRLLARLPSLGVMRLIGPQEHSLL
jgi:hypothetical protein